MASSTTMTAVWIMAGLFLLVFLSFAYTYFIKPRPRLPGQYVNPRIGRRRITKIIFPDGIGNLKGFIDEEPNNEYSSIVVDIAGQEAIIPHVNINRDCAPQNIKQFAAGGDEPILLCCVDQNGLRHPEMFDSLMAPGIEPVFKSDLTKETNRLKREVATLKQSLKDVSSDSATMDKLDDLTDHISRFRQTMLRYTMPGEEEGPQEEQQNKQQGGRR